MHGRIGKILNRKQRPVSFGYRDTHRTQLRVEQIFPMWRRFHPLLLQAHCARPFRNVFSNRAETRAGKRSPGGHVRLARKLMRKRILPRQPQSVLPRRFGQRCTPRKRRQSPRRPFAIRGLEQNLLRAVLAVQCKGPRWKKTENGDSHGCERWRELHDLPLLIFVTHPSPIHSLDRMASSDGLEMLAFPPANPPDDSESGNTSRDIMIEAGEQPTEWDLLWWT